MPPASPVKNDYCLLESIRLKPKAGGLGQFPTHKHRKGSLLKITMKRAKSLVVRNMCALIVVIAGMSSWTVSQTSAVQAKPITDADVKLMREDIQSLKTQIITDTMNFNEKEAASFWPVYKEYAAAQQSIAEALRRYHRLRPEP
ncbi:MAG: hypothetical protein C5B58_02470 [Acidobacteria bacterium]|nr:MAG: hypothetical protein C5B58_02470 [Acidobacteriota bacterium]